MSIEQEISGDILMELNGDALKELGITAYGRRYKIMHAIDALKANHQHHQPPTMTPATTAPVSPTAATAAEGTDGMYQFPRKAPMPPHDSFLTVSPTSSSSMSRSNTFRTVSSKVSSSSSSNGGNVTSTTTSIDKASQPKSSFENNIILSDPFAPAAGMQETTTTPVSDMIHLPCPPFTMSMGNNVSIDSSNGLWYWKEIIGCTVCVSIHT